MPGDSGDEARLDAIVLAYKQAFHQLAEHIVQTKEGDFDPSQFVDTLKKKQAGIPAAREQAPSQAPNVINLMDALRRSITDENPAPNGGWL